MQSKTVTITRTFTRNALLQQGGSARQPYNETNINNWLMRQLLYAGIPVVGILGVIAVEWGILSVRHEDGFDGDEWTFGWTGAEVPKNWRHKAGVSGYRNRLDQPLVERIAADEEF